MGHQAYNDGTATHTNTRVVMELLSVKPERVKMCTL
jgi:hypothetical protein